MKDMPYLEKRGDIYLVRRRVPKELVAVMGCRDVRKWLGRISEAKAKQLAVAALAKINGKFQEAQDKANQAAVLAGPPRPLDDLGYDEITALVESWYRAKIARTAATGGVSGEELAEDGELEPTMAQRHADAAWYADRALMLSGAKPDKIGEKLHDIIYQLVRAENLKMRPRPKNISPVGYQGEVEADPEGRKYLHFLEELRRAEIDYCRLDAERLNGRVHTDIQQIASSVPKPRTSRFEAQHTLGNLMQEFLDDPSRRGMQKTKDEYNFLFRLMDEVIGKETPLDQITRDDCRKVVNLLVTIPAHSQKRFKDLTFADAAKMFKNDKTGQMKPLGDTTITNYVNKMAGLFRYAVQEQRIDRNPAVALRKRLKSHSAEDRHPFSAEQLTKIFSAPVYTGCQDDQHNWRHAGPNTPRGMKFWVPLIALFHGMRLNEICQLRVSDIEIKDSIACFNVNGAGEHQKVKTASGKRLVPFHPMFDANKLNFMTYVNTIKQQGHEQLFPDLEKDRRGYYSDGFQKWFARFLISADAKTDKTSFHSFRHSWRDALREANVPQERAQALGGWKTAGVDAKYGSGLKVKERRSEIAKVKYPGLDLSHLLRW